MLTADLVRPRMRVRDGRLVLNLLAANDGTRALAADLIALLAAQQGKPLRTWRGAVEQVEGTRTDYLIVRGLAKVLEDGATFAPQTFAFAPAALRAHLFAGGAAFAAGDLFDPATRADQIASAAAAFAVAPDEIEAALFSDYPGEHLLVDEGAAWTPDALIDRYNLELARGVLYACDRMDVTIHDGYKDFWRYLKLFKLMFEAHPLDGGGYAVAIDGAISPFVSQTTRYGRQMAAFLPALLLGERWTMRASVHVSGRQALYTLDPKTPLRSHFRRSDLYDSRMEADFAAAFEAKFGGARGAWRLERESEVILLGDTVMIPDFSVTHKKDGRRALIEIVGFWHPDYLQRKIDKVRAAGRRDLILLIYEGVNLSGARLLHVPSEVLYFANKPVLKDVIAAVERAALSV